MFTCSNGLAGRTSWGTFFNRIRLVGSTTAMAGEFAYRLNSTALQGLTLGSVRPPSPAASDIAADDLTKLYHEIFEVASSSVVKERGLTKAEAEVKERNERTVALKSYQQKLSAKAGT